MRKPKPNRLRERRIEQEIVVDAYTFKKGEAVEDWRYGVGMGYGS